MALPKSFVPDSSTPKSFMADPSPLDGFGAIDRRDWIDKAGSFLKEKNVPGAQLGAAVGNSLGSLFQAGKFALGGNLTAAKAALQVTPDEPTPAQVVGDVAQAAATPASLAGGGTAGPFVQRLMASTGLGAVIAGGSTASQGGDKDEVAKSAALGGAFGAFMPVAGKGLRVIGDQLDNLPNRFIQSALGRSKADVLKDMKAGKDPLAQFVLKKKSIGTAESLVTGSQKAIEDLSTSIKTNLAGAVRGSGSPVTIARDNFLDELASLPEAQGALLKRADVKTVIERLAPQAKQLLQKKSWTLTEANTLRQLLDRTVGDRGFLSSQLSTDKLILRSSANGLRETVKAKAPEETRALFSELSSEIKLRDALLDKLAQRAGNQVLSFGDLVGGGLGGVFGGGIPGAIAGVGVRRVIESVPFKMSAAKTIDALTKAGPVLEQLAPAQQTALLTLFAEIFSPDAEESQQEALPQ